MAAKHVHFIGICGTAMGSVAAAAKDRGMTVTGSDENVYPPISTFLESKGIEIFSGYKAGNIPAGADLVVVGNAMSRGNEEVEAVLERKLLYTSLPEFLKQEFLRGKRNLVVTGTHGKTTSSSMLAWILKSAGRNPSFMIGGIPKNLDQGSVFTESEFVVMEGDEYDTAFFDKRSKFIHYLPEVVVVNNIEFDHADIFDNLDDILLSFRRMLNIVPRNGMVFINGDDENCVRVGATCPAPVKSLGLGGDCDLRITDIDYQPGETSFSLEGEQYMIPMDGEFNVRNAAMAAAAARFSGVLPEEIRTALAAFAGIKRRQEVRGEVRGMKIIDDFAHHPTALKQAIIALKRRFPGGKLWALFEPRSATTKRNVFQEELPAALAEADGVIVAKIPMPEKVPEDQRLDPAAVMDGIRKTGKPAHYEESTDGIIARVRENAVEGDTIAVFSNGGFDNIHERLLAEL